jgi:hypothetical protein
MTLFDFLLLLGKGTVMEYDGIWINMDQYVHDSKEASGPVSLRIPSCPQQSPNFLEHLKPHIGRSAKDAKEDVDSCCYWTLLLLLAVWFCLVFISLIEIWDSYAPTDCDMKLSEFSLRAALPGWLYAAFSLTDTLGYPVWAPSHEAWLLNMVSENFGDAWIQIECSSSFPIFSLLENGGFTSRFQTHPTTFAMGGWS